MTPTSTPVLKCSRMRLLRNASTVVASFFLLAAGLAQSPADSTFRITPLRPVPELEREARATQPPQETGNFRQPDLVEVIKLDPTIKLDIRYATANNFLSTPMYSQPRAFLQRPAAEALVRVQRALKEQGYGL